MTEREAFLRQMWANPKEDTTKLVYADYLEENGFDLRAHYIRASITMFDQINLLPQEKQDEFQAAMSEYHKMIFNKFPEFTNARRRIRFNRGVCSLYMPINRLHFVKEVGSLFRELDVMEFVITQPERTRTQFFRSEVTNPMVNEIHPPQLYMLRRWDHEFDREIYIAKRIRQSMTCSGRCSTYWKVTLGIAWKVK